MSAVAKRHWNIRISQADFDVAKQQADALGLSQTEYAVRALTGRLDQVGLEQRVHELEQRLERIERATVAGY